MLSGHGGFKYILFADSFLYELSRLVSFCYMKVLKNILAQEIALTSDFAAYSEGGLLVVDDDENVLNVVCRIMKAGNWAIHTACGGEEALEVFHRVKPQVVISNCQMAGMDGVVFLSKVHEADSKVQCIVLTSLLEQLATHNLALEALVFRFIFKPWNERQFFLTVQSAFKQYAFESEHFSGVVDREKAELQAFNLKLEQKIFERTQQLSAAKREWETTFDAIETPLALVETKDLRLRRINRAYAQYAQREVSEVSGYQRCFAFLFGRDTACEGCPLSKEKESFFLEKGLQAEIRQNNRTIDLKVYPMESGKISICSYRDISEEREMQRRLAEAEKMVAMGRLAGGVAHEINNPLSGILAFVQLMKRGNGRSTKDMELLGLMEVSALRCKRIVESLLQFSRKSRPEDKRLVDFGRCVEDVVVLFRAQAIDFPKLTVEFSVEPNLPHVDGNFGEIGQIVLGLLQNGLYALKDGIGTLSVKVGQREDYCFVSVSDDGIGIPEEHLSHIFEPHFTTKPVGKGTGLGLSIAYQIVSEHGGKFEVKSEVGVGTTFWVFFPAQFQETKRP